MIRINSKNAGLGIQLMCVWEVRDYMWLNLIFADVRKMNDRGYRSNIFMFGAMSPAYTNGSIID